MKKNSNLYLMFRDAMSASADIDFLQIPNGPSLKYGDTDEESDSVVIMNYSSSYSKTRISCKSLIYINAKLMDSGIRRNEAFMGQQRTIGDRPRFTEVC